MERPLVTLIICLLFLFTISGTTATPVHSTATGTGLGADCNNLNQRPNVPNFICADPLRKTFTNALGQSYYIGHDEASIQFLSSAPGSASNLQWTMSLPGADPVANQAGTSVATFENYVAAGVQSGWGPWRLARRLHPGERLQQCTYCRQRVARIAVLSTRVHKGRPGTESSELLRYEVVCCAEH